MHKGRAPSTALGYGPAPVKQLREVGVIWSAELQRAARGAKSIVTLVLYLMFTAVVMLPLGLGAYVRLTQIADHIAQYGSSPEAIQEQLAVAKQIVSAVFNITLYFLPFYIAVLGFDQISGEIGPRSIRYLTVRTHRSSILWGKFLAQATFLGASVLVVDLAILGATRWLSKASAFDIGTTLLKCWLAAVIFSLAYLALSSLFSALFRSSAASLIFNFFALFGLLLMNIVGAIAAKAAESSSSGDGAEAPSRVVTALSWLRYASPWHYSSDLLDPDRLKVFQSAGVFVGFAAGFLALGYAVLRRRDI